MTNGTSSIASQNTPSWRVASLLWLLGGAFVSFGRILMPLPLTWADLVPPLIVVVLAIGLFAKQPWARILVFVSVFLFTVPAVVTYLVGNQYSAIFMVLGMSGAILLPLSFSLPALSAHSGSRS